MDFEDFDNLALWQQSDADYICLEPWTSPGSFSDPSGLIVKKKKVCEFLKPHETVDYKYTVTLFISCREFIKSQSKKGKEKQYV